MLQEVLYHRDIGFPKSLKMKSVSCVLKYSNHALKQSHRHGSKIKLPKSVQINPEDIVELGMINRKPSKILIRKSYSVKDDLILVISTDNNVVRTVWLNDKNDQHNTLDMSKYTVPN